jgi:hypothetical protein
MRPEPIAICILTSGLCALDIGIERPVAAFLVQVVHQRQQTGGFASLARGVEQEILLLVDQRQDFVKIPALQGR